MAQKVLLLGACCAGKSSLCDELRLRHHNVLECDEAVMRSAGGVWPASADENRRLVIEAASQACAMTHVIFLTSWVPTAMLERARGRGFTVALLEVPKVELERRNRTRLAEGGCSDVSHWFDPQLANHAELVAGGLVDVVLDGTLPQPALAGEVALLSQR